MRRPWTESEIIRAKAMRAVGVPLYEIDRYFGRPRNSTWQKLATLEKPDYRDRQVHLKRQWRAQAA